MFPWVLCQNSLAHSRWTWVVPGVCLSIQESSKHAHTHQSMYLFQSLFLALLLGVITLPAVAWTSVLLEMAKHTCCFRMPRSLCSSASNVKVRPFPLEQKEVTVSIPDSGHPGGLSCEHSLPGVTPTWGPETFP